MVDLSGGLTPLCRERLRRFGGGRQAGAGGSAGSDSGTGALAATAKSYKETGSTDRCHSRHGHDQLVVDSDQIGQVYRRRRDPLALGIQHGVEVADPRAAYNDRHTPKVMMVMIVATIRMSINAASARHHHEARGTPSAVVVACADPVRGPA